MRENVLGESIAEVVGIRCLFILIGVLCKMSPVSNLVRSRNFHLSKS